MRPASRGSSPLSRGSRCLGAARGASAQCVDEELKQELVGGRHYRGVQERLFTKAFRHELSAMGGWYAADLYSSNWLAGGAYTFHFSEDLGLEASVQFTHVPQRGDRLVRAALPADPGHQQPEPAGTLYFGHLVWSLRVRQAALVRRRHHPLRLQRGLRRRRDRRRRPRAAPRQAPGRGEVLLRQVVRRALDVRDHVLREVLVGDEHLVNDMLVTLGASVFIPFGG